MVTISLCMIVKNEQDTLPRCLDSVSGIFDEIIIVDTGSTDATKKEALKFTDKIFDFEWIDDFSAARNFAFSKASSQFCMWLDADDVILPPDKESILTLKQTLSPDTDIVMMKYNITSGGNDTPVLTYYRERIIRSDAGFVWEGKIHEAISPRGKIVYSNAAVTHKKMHISDPDRNLRIFEKMIKNGEKLSPREQFYYARELTYHSRDKEAAEILESFIDSGKGWRQNVIEACRLLSECYTRMGARGKALDALLKALREGTPTAELCCDIGLYFFNGQNWKTAAFWYNMATLRPKDEAGGGFVSPDCYGYIPYIQMCVCYYKMGEIEKAKKFNEIAGQFKPDSTQVEYNRQFFTL